MKSYVIFWVFWNLMQSIHALESCTAGLDDAGSSLIQQLYSSIKQAECDLVNGTIYKQYDPVDNEDFDFIIVGAGSAGCVVANRLTEEPNWTVLLLEAGGDPTVASEIPGLLFSTAKSSIDWSYEVEKDPNYCVPDGCLWPRGKVMGGSSSINNMVYSRGHPKDYDGWAGDGNAGWSYADVLPYFKKSEDLQAQEVMTTNYEKYHGEGGYLKVGTLQKHFIEQYLSSILAERGYRSYNDVNADHHQGLFRFQGQVWNSRRISSAKAFIKPVEDRPNLKVSKNSLVTKVLIDKSKSAYGVLFLNRKGEMIQVNAKKEVILSAGSINSPQLLMLSGVGPKEHLQSFGIEVVQDLPVGKNLQDHLELIGIAYTLNIAPPLPSSIDEMYKYLTSTSEVLSSVGISNVAFIDLESEDYPNVELLFGVINFNDSSSLIGFCEAMQINTEIQNSFLEMLSQGSLLLLSPILLRPKSSGEILLRSKNPQDYPKIYPKYLSKEEDFKVFLKAIRFLTTLGDTKAMQSLGGKLQKVKISTCDAMVYDSSEYWLCILKHLARTVYHPVGTCKMGPATDTSSVVDPELKVIGLNNLRVVDASIIPKQLSANINAGVVMIGEKGSDMIKCEWEK